MTKQRRAHAGIRFLASRLGVSSLPVKHVDYEPDLRVPMRDGTVLLAHRWSPSPGGPAPLVLVRSPYGRGSLQGLTFGRLLAHQGLQVVIQSCRGTAGSGGTFETPFSVEADDGQDTITWLQQQPWYPGAFATLGASYLGYTQLALAQAAPQEHVAAVLIVTPTSVRDIAWPDGTFSPGLALRWAATAARDPAAPIRSLLGASRLDKGIRRAAGTGALRDSYQQLTGGPVPFFEEWLDNEEPSAPVWKELDQSAGLESLSCPVLVQAGWYDIFLECSLRQYARLRERGVDARLTVGPWTHASIGFQAMPDVIEFLREVLLNGAPRAAGSRVRLTDTGADKEQRLDEWPDKARAQTYYLGSAGLSATPPLDETSTTIFTFDPADPTPQAGGALLDLTGAGAQDNRKLEARSDVVTFDTHPFEQSATVRGHARVTMTFASDRPATCVFLRLCDVAQNGTSTNLTDRMVPLAANGESRWDLDIELPPTSAAIAAGHRLRLQISSGAFPRFLPHSGTDEPQTGAARRFPAHQTVHHSSQRPATLTVPLAQSAS